MKDVRRPSPLRFLPAVLFLVAAASLVLLGLRSLATERAVAERTARARLQGIAREAAGDLAAAAARLTSEAAAAGPGAAVHRGGRFVVPAEPTPMRPLVLEPGTDREGAFYLAEAERAEARGRDPARAEGLYRAAASDARSEACRAIALFRLAALERRTGRAEQASATTVAFLDSLPAGAGRTREALVARALSRPVDPTLQDDLLLFIGSDDEAIAFGLLEEAGVADEAAFAARRRDLERIERLRPVLLDADARPSGARLTGGRLVAWTRAADGEVLIAEGPPPGLPPGLALVPPGRSAPSPDSLVEEVSVGPPLLDARVAASQPRREIEREADRRVLLVGAALAVLLAGGGAALLLMLRAVRREAEAAQARVAFVTRVGHDLRTPLTLIRMYAETLAGGRVADPVEVKEFAAIAAREAERLSGLVANVLDLSRVASPAALQRRRVDLARLVCEVAEAHRPLLAERGLRLAVSTNGASLLIDGNEDALRGALGNLLENALRHAASGGVVEAEAHERGGLAEVRVLDRGPGIPAEIRDRVFDRFVRGPGATERGAGLGLALVREVAEAHGGSVRAEERKGGGAALTISLPLAGRGDS